MDGIGKRFIAIVMHALLQVSQVYPMEVKMGRYNLQNIYSFCIDIEIRFDMFDRQYQNYNEYHEAH